MTNASAGGYVSRRVYREQGLQPEALVHSAEGLYRFTVRAFGRFLTWIPYIVYICIYICNAIYDCEVKIMVILACLYFSAFLESEEGGELLELERSFFDQILERIQEGNDAWQSLTSEQLLSYGGVMVSFVVGLYSGWSARQWTLVDEIMYSSLDRSNRLGECFGASAFVTLN